MTNALIAALVLGGLGIFFGLLLAISSKVFYVKVDEREEKVASCLNGANCGGCGYAGCAAYAAAIVRDGAPIDRCTPAGQEGVKAIAAIMGVEAVEMARQVAFVRCSGGDKAQVKYAYNGVKDCALAAQAIGGGQRSCAYGCLGCHLCEKFCPHNAIHVIDNLSVKDYSKCQNCGICAEKCPRKLIFIHHPDLTKRPGA